MPPSDPADHPDFAMRSTNGIRIICALLILVAVGVITCPGQVVPAEARHEIRGTWTLKSIYPTQNVQGPGPSQQRQLLQSQIVIGVTSIKACGQSVTITSADVKAVSASEFLANNLVPLDSVGIHKPSVVEVILNQRQSGTCFGAFPMPGQDIYIKGSDELVIAFEGVFYRAIRDKAQIN